MSWLDSIADSVDMNLSKLKEIVKDREVWRAADPNPNPKSNLNLFSTLGGGLMGFMGLIRIRPHLAAEQQ